MSYATCTILQCDYRAFLLHETSKTGMLIWKFHWWIYQGSPYLPQWRMVLISLIGISKPERAGKLSPKQIIDRIQSEPKHNYWGARKNVQSVIVVPRCIFPFWLWHTDERNQNHSPLRQVVDPWSIPSRKFLNTPPIMCPKSYTSSNCNVVTGNLKCRFGNYHA